MFSYRKLQPLKFESDMETIHKFIYVSFYLISLVVEKIFVPSIGLMKKTVMTI